MSLKQPKKGQVTRTNNPNVPKIPNVINKQNVPHKIMKTQ